MMRNYHGHEGDAHVHTENSEMHARAFYANDTGPDPRYYRNAPRYDERHINTSSDECNTVCSVSHHSPDHSPKSTCTAARTTPAVHANDDMQHFEDERDAPEEEVEYWEDSYNTTDEQEEHWEGEHDTHYHHHHHHPMPAYGYEQHSERQDVFVPIDAPPHGFHRHESHHPNEHYMHQQPSYSHARFDNHYQYQMHGNQHQHQNPPQDCAAAQYQQDQHVNDTSYSTNTFDAPLLEHYQHASPPRNGENQHGETQVVGAYNERDVLCGRGALMIWHPGNQFFRGLVQKHRQRYFFSRRQEKKNIASQIIDEIRAVGGRFLRRSQASDGLNEINVWVEIDEDRAYQKCCQALREGAPDIRRQWRNKPTRGASRMAGETKENDDNAASK